MTMLSNLAPIPELYVSYDSAQKLKVEAGELKSLDLDYGCLAVAGSQ